MDEFKEKIENQQCRTCYNSTKGLRRLTNQTKCSTGNQQQQKSYAELLKEVSNINVMEDLYAEQMPQLICEVCARRLKAAHVFIQQTWEVNERLKAIAGQMEANKDLKCLQEAPVDILPIADIKSEQHDDEEMDFLGQFEPECFVELKEEKSDSSGILKDDFKADMLDLQKADQNSIEIITLAECQSSDPNSITADSSKTNNDYSLDEDNNNFSDVDADSDWKDENDDVEETQNIKPEKKKNSPKSRKSSNNADDDIAVPCAECNKIFTNAKALARHQRNTHVPEEQKCTCSLCGRRFSRSCNMYKHMRTFHGADSVPLLRKPSNKERSFQCDKCEKNYTKKSHLTLHMKEKHNPENSNQETDKPEQQQQSSEATETKPQDGSEPKKDKPKKRYEVRSLCSICGSSFASRTHLVVHMRRHTGERPFKCDLCERAYPRLSELVCHRRIHTGEKPFKCKICDKAFRVWSKMSNHMRSHTDIRPYKCTQCERSFKYSKDLNIHFRIHTGERPYKCNVCGSTFTQSNTLKAHRSKLGHMDDAVTVVGGGVPSNHNLVQNYGTTITMPTQITHI